MIEVAIIKHKAGQGDNKTHSMRKFTTIALAQKFVKEYNKRGRGSLDVDYATIIASW